MKTINVLTVFANTFSFLWNNYVTFWKKNLDRATSVIMSLMKRATVQ